MREPGSSPNLPPPQGEPSPSPEEGNGIPLTGPARSIYALGKVLEPAVLIQLVVHLRRHRGQRVLRRRLAVHGVARRGEELVPQQVALGNDRSVVAVRQKVREDLLISGAEGRIPKRGHPGRIVA